MIIIGSNDSKSCLVDLLLESSCCLKGGKQVETVILRQFNEPIVIAEDCFSLGVDAGEDGSVGFVERNLELNQRGRGEVVLGTAIESFLHSHPAVSRAVSNVHVDEMVVRVVTIQQTELLVFVDFPLLG